MTHANFATVQHGLFYLKVLIVTDKAHVMYTNLIQPCTQCYIKIKLKFL